MKKVVGIEVSGFRGSLNVALMSKREAVGSKETILAEDSASFQISNIADVRRESPRYSDRARCR